MIEITITVKNTETGFGKITKESVTLDEFKEMMQGAPAIGWPSGVESAEDLGKGVEFFHGHPLFKIFTQLINYMIQDIVDNRNKLLESNEKTERKDNE